MDNYIIILLIFGAIFLLLYYLYNYRKWKNIKALNKGLGITKKTCYIDNYGYLRWKETDKLCHREIAWKYGMRSDSERFGECDVHHKDENKLNNQPSNLEVLTREKHSIEHGAIIYDNGTKYIKLGRISKIYRETSDAILMAYKWIPKSQCIFRDEYVYVSERAYNQKFRD